MDFAIFNITLFTVVMVIYIQYGHYSQCTFVQTVFKTLLLSVPKTVSVNVAIECHPEFIFCLWFSQQTCGKLHHRRNNIHLQCNSMDFNL